MERKYSQTTFPVNKAVNMCFLCLLSLICWDRNVPTKRCGNFLVSMTNNNNNLHLTAFYDSQSTIAVLHELVCTFKLPGDLVKGEY